MMGGSVQQHPMAAKCSNTNHISPVLIVGGGPTGLFLSLLLARYNVHSIVLEQMSMEERFQHPQAHFLNTRTMEILRHSLPSVYDTVKRQMTHVSEWQHFRFGGANILDPQAIAVRHPVDIPLQADQDANGVLAEDNQVGTTRRDLSPVTVGHLPQHIFGKILYDAAKRSPTITVLYGTKVTQIVHSANAVQLQTTREDGHCRPCWFTTDSWCIGADGAHSLVRRQCEIRRHGTAEIQHLMNVHVRHSYHGPSHVVPPPAMLYATFAPQSVAMTVRHSADEYIVQIPFFPPYQTPPEDFTREKLVGIVSEIFGEPVEAAAIVSAQPWTMGSLVAERYVQDKVVLIGDAAHVFPPAGGLGMNTGLQDAHNLAWKIAAGMDLDTYETERRPVAQQNAALSVRNYERLLKVTQAAYLDKRHPELLQYMLNRSSLLPLSARKGIFRSLYLAALFPFRWLLQSDGMYANHIRSNLRSALQSGMGLPLLFPAYEIGFSYPNNASPMKTVNNNDKNEVAKDHQTKWRQDTIPLQPVLATGALVPYAKVMVVSSAAETTNKPDIHSTVDLPAQLHIESTDPVFVLFCWKPNSLEPRFLQELAGELALQIGLLVKIVVISDTAEDLKRFPPESTFVLLLTSENSASFGREPGVVLIRPDGHVGGMVSRSTLASNHHNLSVMVEELIRFSRKE